jgi:hypothetical protein
MQFPVRRVALLLVGLLAGVFAVGAIVAPSMAQVQPSTAAAPHAVRVGHVATAGGTPQEVQVGIYLNQLLNVDLTTNTYEADFYMWFKWKGDIDPTGSYDFVNQTEAWAAKILPTYEKPTEDANGVKYQSWHIQAKFVQPLNFASYPKTGYGMHIAIEDNTYDNTALVFVTPTGLETAENIVSPGGWSVSDPTAGVVEHTYNTNFGDPAAKAPITFSQANFNFVIERSDPTRLIKAILPIIIIMAITLLAFLIPPRHLDARLLLTVTALISAVLLHDSAVGELPRVGYFVAIDKVYLLSYAVVFLTLLESTIVYRLASTDREALAKKVDRISIAVLGALFVIGAFLALSVS